MVNVIKSEPLGAQSPGSDSPASADSVGSGTGEPLLALLRAYNDVFNLLEATPKIVWMRASAGPLGRHLRLPRLQWLARRLASWHVAQSISQLKRGCYAAAALDEQSAIHRRDVAMLEDFERSLVPVSVRRAVTVCIVGSFFVAYGMANIVQAHQTKFIGDFTTAIVELDRHGVVQSFNEISPLRLAGAAILSLWAVWLVTVLPALAFLLKREAFNFPASSADELADTPARDHAAPCTGVYDLERQAFAAAGTRQPNEPPLDLIWRGMVIASVAIWGIWLLLIEKNPVQPVAGIVFLAIAIRAAAKARRQVLRRWKSAPDPAAVPSALQTYS